MDNLKKIRKDTLIIFFIFASTFITRVLFLDKIPPGIHGDETWTGLDAIKIIQHGAIPAYVGSALGQPSGPIYFTAFIFKLMGSSIFSLRFSIALIAVVSVACYYIFLRLFFDRLVSFLTTILYSFSFYQLHYSRTGFMLITSILPELIAMILLILAERRRKNYLFFLSAFFLGVGVYTYNTFLPFSFLFLLSLFFIPLFFNKSFLSFKKACLYLLIFIGTAIPLLYIIITSPGFYFSHHREVSIFNQEKFKVSVNIFQKSKVVIDNSSKNIFNFFINNYDDGVDGYENNPFFSIIQSLLFLAGILLLFKNKNKIHNPDEEKYLYLMIWGIIFFLILFLNSLTNEGIYRRNVVVFFYIYLLIGYFIKNVYEFSIKLKIQKQIFVILVVCVFAISILELKSYYIDFSQSKGARFTFSYDLVQAVLKLKSVNKQKSNYYLLSSRWGCNYETIKFLYGDIGCEDKSSEFSSYDLDFKKNSYIILLNRYMLTEKKIKEKYPNTIRVDYLKNNYTLLKI